MRPSSRHHGGDRRCRSSARRLRLARASGAPVRFVGASPTRRSALSRRRRVRDGVPDRYGGLEQDFGMRVLEVAASVPAVAGRSGGSRSRRPRRTGFVVDGRPSFGSRPLFAACSRTRRCVGGWARPLGAGRRNLGQDLAARGWLLRWPTWKAEPAGRCGSRGRRRKGAVSGCTGHGANGRRHRPGVVLAVVATSSATPNGSPTQGGHRGQPYRRGPPCRGHVASRPPSAAARAHTRSTTIADAPRTLAWRQTAATSPRSSRGVPLRTFADGGTEVTCTPQVELARPPSRLHQAACSEPDHAHGPRRPKARVESSSLREPVSGEPETRAGGAPRD